MQIAEEPTSQSFALPVVVAAAKGTLGTWSASVNKYNSANNRAHFQDNRAELEPGDTIVAGQTVAVGSRVLATDPIPYRDGYPLVMRISAKGNQISVLLLQHQLQDDHVTSSVFFIHSTSCKMIM